MRSQARLLMPWSCFGKSRQWCGASERLRLSRRKRESPCRCERSFEGFDSYAMPSIANWRLLAASSIHGFDRFLPSRREATTTIPGFRRAAELDDEVRLWLCEAYRSAQQLPSLPTENRALLASPV